MQLDVIVWRTSLLRLHWGESPVEKGLINLDSDWKSLAVQVGWRTKVAERSGCGETALQSSPRVHEITSTLTQTLCTSKDHKGQLTSTYVFVCVIIFFWIYMVEHVTLNPYSNLMWPGLTVWLMFWKPVWKQSFVLLFHLVWNHTLLM